MAHHKLLSDGVATEVNEKGKTFIKDIVSCIREMFSGIDVSEYMLVHCILSYSAIEPYSRFTKKAKESIDELIHHGILVKFIINDTLHIGITEKGYDLFN